MKLNILMSLNINTLRQQNHLNSLDELNKTSEILKEFYYEKSLNPIGYTYYNVGSYLEEFNNILIRDWDNKDLYVYNILDEDRNSVCSGSYTEIIKELKSDKINRVKGALYVRAFKVKENEPEVVPVLKSTDSEIEKLKTDISEIKDLLKKLVI